MKRVVLGLVLGMWMAPGSGIADKRSESLDLLCVRFDAVAARTMAENAGVVQDMDKRLKAPWRNDEKIQERIDRAEAGSVVRSLGAVRRMVCPQ